MCKYIPSLAIFTVDRNQSPQCYFDGSVVNRVWDTTSGKLEKGGCMVLGLYVSSPNSNLFMDCKFLWIFFLAPGIYKPIVVLCIIVAVRATSHVTILLLLSLLLLLLYIAIAVIKQW